MNSDEIIKQVLDEVRNFNIDDLPNIDLYMDQVTTYLNNKFNNGKKIEVIAGTLNDEEHKTGLILTDYLIDAYNDYYNKESEKKDIAEVIIAKQRGGQTGTVELLWMGQYTKFVNLERRFDD